MKHDINSQKIRCIITGAGGYLGSHIKNYFSNEGYEVIELKHHLTPEDKLNKNVFPFLLEKELEQNIFQCTDILIHTAYDFRAKNWEEVKKINVEGSISLIKKAKEANIKKVIFISSMAAFNGCKSMYGKAKLEIEKEALKNGAIVIRPGLIYDETPTGIFGALNKVISVSNIVPLIDFGNQIIYMTHIKDLCKLIFKLVTEDLGKINNPIIAANKEGLTFKSILKKLADKKFKKVVFVPLPHQLIWFSLKLCEALCIPSGFRSDSLISIINANPSIEFDESLSKHVNFRSFS